MSQPIFKRVQKRNPHQLVIDQHIHAAHCIKPFCEPAGYVSVYDKSSAKWIKRKPDAAIFCAKRAWDQRAEKGYMHSIETAYFNVIDNLSISHEKRNHDAISRYFHLWRLRGLARDKERRDVRFNGVTGSRLTLDQQEVLESNYMLFTTEEDGMPHHIAAGMEIQITLAKICHLMGPTKWGLLNSIRGEFLVADFYTGDESGFIPFMPITPYCAFYADCEDGFIDINRVREFNKLTVESAQSYFFCKDVTKCPF